MINQFIDDVISKGAEASLPQNLSDEWLDVVTAAAVNLLKDLSGDSESGIEVEDAFENVESAVMMAAVMEIIQHTQDYPVGVNINEEILVECLKCYALYIAIEYIGRQMNVVIEHPTLENIFDQEKIASLEMSNPIITDALIELVHGDDED